MKRFVLYNEEVGIYLGNCMGLGFWSKLDSAGQERACVFETPEQAEAHLASHDDPVKNCVTREVECDDSNYATISELEAAGLPTWTV